VRFAVREAEPAQAPAPSSGEAGTAAAASRKTAWVICGLSVAVVAAAATLSSTGRITIVPAAASSPPYTAPASVAPSSVPPASVVVSSAPPPAAPVTSSLPEPFSVWALNDDVGTTARDSVRGNPAIGSNFVWCSAAVNGDCAAFQGRGSQFVTSGPVLVTGPGSSFTVAANVYMSAEPAAGGYETFVSQDSADDSGFALQYSSSANSWVFSRTLGDTDNSPASAQAVSTSVPELNTWAHLVGVYDASDGQLRLYVDGVLEGSATDSTPFAATGPLAIGRGQYNGQPTDWFTGAMGQVEVWNVALTTAQVDQT
jgi:Concanavalin A-like lectin/glucanases superfamily